MFSFNLRNPDLAGSSFEKRPCDGKRELGGLRIPAITAASCKCPILRVTQHVFESPAYQNSSRMSRRRRRAAESRGEAQGSQHRNTTARARWNHVMRPKGSRIDRVAICQGLARQRRSKGWIFVFFFFFFFLLLLLWSSLLPIRITIIIIMNIMIIIDNIIIIIIIIAIWFHVVRAMRL